jgi:acetate kinase
MTNDRLVLEINAGLSSLKYLLFQPNSKAYLADDIV